MSVLTGMRDQLVTDLMIGATPGKEKQAPADRPWATNRAQSVACRTSQGSGAAGSLVSIVIVARVRGKHKPP
jgi:hypothetical protein